MKRTMSFKRQSLAFQDINLSHEIKEDFEKLSAEERLYRTFRILEKPQISRSGFDISQLQKLTIDMPFFKEHCDHQAHHSCCKSMKYLHGTKDQVLFDIGQKGTQFFIILRGTVSVLIRTNLQQSLQEVSQLSDGKYFGELALMNDNALRSATIKLKTECHFAYLEKETYQSILMVKQYQELKENVKIYQQIPYFNIWGERDLIRILYRREPKTYHYNQVVYSQGDVSQGVFFIKSGVFKVQMEVSYARDDLGQGELYQQLLDPLGSKKDKLFKTIDLSILPIGHSFGEEDTYFQLPRQSSVKCYSQEGQLYMLSKDDLKRRVYWDQTVVNNLKTHISMRQKHTAKMIEYQGNLLNSAEREVNEFKSKKYMEQQPRWSPKTILKTEGSQNSLRMKGIFKLEDAFDISSKRDKLFSHEFVPSQNMPNITPSSKKSFQTNRLKTAQSSFILSQLPTKLTHSQSEQRISPIKRSIFQDKKSLVKIKVVIQDLIQRMKDKINGRIIKKNKLMDDIQFGQQQQLSQIRNKKSSQDILQTFKPAKNLDYYKHLNMTIHKRTRTLKIIKS